MEKYSKFSYRWICTVVICVSNMMVNPVTALDEFELSAKCDGEISMILKDFYQGRLTVTSPLSPDDFPHCMVKVESWPSFNKMMFYFEDFNVSCQEGQIEFFDGELSTGKRVKGLELPICGDSKPEGVFVTDNIALRILYSEKSRLLNTGTKVAIIVTAFDEDSCVAGYQYECDNGRCINDDINCSGYNPCGDNSDCQSLLSTGEWIGIGFGCLFGLVLIISVVVGAICFLRSTNRRNKIPQQQVYYNSTDGSTTFAQPKPFVTGHQPMYSNNISNQNYMQGEGQKGQQMYPTLDQTMQSPPQTGNGVQQATYGEPTNSTQSTAPTQEIETSYYSTLDSATQNEQEYNKTQM